MISLFALVAAHVCHIPPIACSDARSSAPLSSRGLKTMERFAYCVCGPDGSVDWDPQQTRWGWVEYPSCNRNGWNGHRYVAARK
jgi:hypothetical protein